MARMPGLQIIRTLLSPSYANFFPTHGMFCARFFSIYLATTHAKLVDVGLGGRAV